MGFIVKNLENNTADIIKISDKEFSFKKPVLVDEPLKKIEGFSWHWTAVKKNVLFNDYHFNISDFSKDILVAKTLSLKTKGQHTWGQNTGLVGLSFCNTIVGDDKPSKEMIELGAILQAELCAWHNLDPNGKFTRNKKIVQGDRLITIAGTDSFDVIGDHCQFSKANRYYPDRWDIGDILPILKQKAIEYHKELKQGKRQFQFLEIIKL